jgi:hypothetical protein
VRSLTWRQLFRGAALLLKSERSTLKWCRQHSNEWLLFGSYGLGRNHNDGPTLAVIMYSLMVAGAPQEIRTPDPQIRSLRVISPPNMARLGHSTACVWD